MLNETSFGPGSTSHTSGCRRLRIASPAFRLSGSQQWETNPKEMPVLGFTTLYPRKRMRSTARATLLQFCSAKHYRLWVLLEKSAEYRQSDGIVFLMYKIPESKTDQSFEYHWDANQVTDVRFKRYIPIFLSFKKEILLVTGLAFHALPQAPSVLTDSMNV